MRNEILQFSHNSRLGFPDKTQKSESENHSVVSDSTDYKVLGILQARILEWVAIPFSRGSSQPRD